MTRTVTSTEESYEGRTPTARPPEVDTKTKLLDTAERLFSDKGFEAVSHRDIAIAAAVNPAAVNYHFGSKREFIRAVIKRQVESINARRLAALAKAEREAGIAPVPTDKLLEAFLSPAVEHSNGSLETSLWMGPQTNPHRDYFIGLMAPVLGRFAGSLHRSLPSRSDEDCQRYVMFSLAALALMVQSPGFLHEFSKSGGERSEAKIGAE
jgi:AcrR family transcriptional regulator